MTHNRGGATIVRTYYSRFRKRIECDCMQQQQHTSRRHSSSFIGGRGGSEAPYLNFGRQSPPATPLPPPLAAFESSEPLHLRLNGRVGAIPRYRVYRLSLSLSSPSPSPPLLSLPLPLPLALTGPTCTVSQPETTVLPLGCVPRTSWSQAVNHS